MSPWKPTSKFSSIINDLHTIEVKIDDEDKICYNLLSLLPKEYDPVVTSIETMATEKRLTFDFVKARLLDAETKIITNKDKTDQENAFITCFTCGKPGHKIYEYKDKTNEREPHRAGAVGDLPAEVAELHEDTPHEVEDKSFLGFSWANSLHHRPYLCLQAKMKVKSEPIAQYTLSPPAADKAWRHNPAACMKRIMSATCARACCPPNCWRLEYACAQLSQTPRS
ncbi:unnamed protein product, partial [Brenthis ino]